jgi:hypothetical protein
VDRLLANVKRWPIKCARRNRLWLCKGLLGLRLPGTVMPHATRLGKTDCRHTNSHSGLTFAVEDLDIVLPKRVSAGCLDPRSWHRAVFTHWPHFATNHSGVTRRSLAHVASKAAAEAICPEKHGASEFGCACGKRSTSRASGCWRRC